MLPDHVKTYIIDKLSPEDVLYELDLTTDKLINALDKAKVDMRVFEAMYIADTQMEIAFDYDED